MEIEKVIRILAIVLIVAALAVRTATCLMFSTSPISSLPILVALIICLGILWRGTAKKQDSK